MRIELARAGDYDAVCAVLAEGDAAHVEQLPDVFRPSTGPVRPKDFLLARIAGPDSAVLVALEGEREVVGVLEIVMKPPAAREQLVPRAVALIDNVTVRASHRSRGIGTTLIERAHAWALARGATAVELNVWSTNPRARALYERLGYVPRVIRMERPLPAR